MSLHASKPNEGATGKPGNSLIGQTLGRYKLLSEIASGGMARVYLARASGAGGFERLVAVKCCHAGLRHDGDFSKMFLDEARLAARIHHPNVVSTLDVGDEDELYIVMEYIEGGGLTALERTAVEREQQIPLSVVLRIVCDSLAGLHAAHEICDADGQPLNIVHRDVTPQNIIVGVDGISRITDFGIAKAEARATVTREGVVKGKLAYMAPEQVSDREVTRRTDIFAAGIVLWEALTLRRLFSRASNAETMGAVLHGEIVAPSRLIPGIPAALDAAVLKALERDPAKRFATAGEFADALEGTGIQIGTARDVGAHIREVLGDVFTSRRAMIRALADAPSSEFRVRAKADASNIIEPVTTTMQRNALRQQAAEASVSATPPPTSIIANLRNDSRVRFGGVGLVLVLVALSIVAVLHHKSTPDSPSHQSAAAPAANRAEATPAPATVTQPPQAATAEPDATHVQRAETRRAFSPTRATPIRARVFRPAPRATTRAGSMTETAAPTSAPAAPTAAPASEPNRSDERVLPSAI